MLSLFTLPDGNLTASAFAPSGHMFTIGCRDGIHIYNVSNGLLNSSISSEGFNPRLAAFTEDECGVVVVSSEWSDDKVSYHIKKSTLSNRMVRSAGSPHGMTSILLHCRNMDRMLHLLSTRTWVPRFVSGRLKVVVMPPFPWIVWAKSVILTSLGSWLIWLLLSQRTSLF